jgi:hypothetical protein
MSVSLAAVSTLPADARSAALLDPAGIDCAGGDGLSPALLDVLPLAAGSVRLTNAGQGLRQYCVLARWAPRVVCEPPTTGRFVDAPIQLTWERQVVVASPKGDAGSHPFLLDACDWIRCVHGLPVAVDLNRMAHINSQMVAWLLRLAQHHTPGRIVVRGASPAVDTQLRQLRLEHFLSLG